MADWVRVSPGVLRLTHGVSNFYLVEESGRYTLIDAGVTADWGRFLAALASQGSSLQNLDAVLLTHAHSDHTGFAERARSEAHAGVWVHGADLSVAKGAPPGRAEARLRPYLRYAEAWRTLFGLILHGGARIVPVLEASAFADGDVIEVAGRPRVVHLPGHTPGMSALFLGQRRVVFTGDGLVTRNPLTGRRGPQIMPRALNQDNRQALASLGKLEGLGADIVLPGHGDPWSRGVADAVQQARAAGFS